MDSTRNHLMRAAQDAPYLTREQEQALAIRWRDQRDRQALHALAEAHMRLVIALAVRFRNYGLPIADLIQEGHVGLMEAAARFEVEREVRFSTYATWWIRAAIQDHVLRNWSIVRGGTSSAQKALFFNLRRLRARLAHEKAERPDLDIPSEIAATLGVSRTDVVAMEGRLSGSDLSLNAPLREGEDGSAERIDTLVCDKPLPDEAVSEQIDGNRRLAWLRQAMGVLSERELRIVRERRLREDAETLEALGGQLGVSKERIRQIEARAIEKIKAAFLALQTGASLNLQPARVPMRRRFA